MALFINDPFLIWKLQESFETSSACACHNWWSFLCFSQSHTSSVHIEFWASVVHIWDWFLQSEHLPRRVSKTHTFKISINKTDPLISWLVLIATQATWIYPFLVYWSSQTCGFFCHMIENPCSICSLQIINCFSLLMDQRETWVYDHNFCGCFPFRCLRWLVLVIFLYYKTRVVNCKCIINGQLCAFRLMVVGIEQIKPWGNAMIKKLT